MDIPIAIAHGKHTQLDLLMPFLVKVVNGVMVMVMVMAIISTASKVITVYMLGGFQL